MLVYEFLSQPPPVLIKNCTSRKKKGICHKVHVMAVISLETWMVFPCEHLHTSCPGSQMGIKGKPTPSTRRLRVRQSWNPSLLNPLYSLAGVPQTKCPHFLFPSLFASKLQEGILISAWHKTGKKHLFLFICLLVPHLTHDFWYPSAEEEEGNDATEPGGPHTSQYKSSHLCINDSVGVSRSLVINSPQHKSVTSTGLKRYLSDVGATESLYQKSLGISKGLPKGQSVDIENAWTRWDLNT